MEIFLQVLFFLYEPISKVLSSLRPMNPKILQRRYYEKHREKMAKLRQEIENARDPDVVLSTLNRRLLARADRYMYRANLAWGRNLEQRYKSGWFTVLAAEAYGLAGSPANAGGCFHYAAHSFRELGEYALSGRYYHQSALSFRQARNTDLAARAARRAVATYRQVEERARAKELEQLLHEWQQVQAQ